MVIMSFVLFKKLRTPAFYLVLMMSIAETAFPMGHIWFLMLHPHGDSWKCNLEGWWLQFFQMCSVYFSFITALNIYLLIVKPQYKLTNERLVKVSGIAIAVSLVCSLIPFATNQYGSLGYACWIVLDEGGRNASTGFAMRFALKYGQVLPISLLNAALYVKILAFFRDVKAKNRTASLIRPSGPDKIEQAILRLQWYPIILTICWSGIIAMRIYEFFASYVPCWSIWLTISVLNMQGFFNALVFFSCDLVWLAWKDLFEEFNSKWTYQSKPSILECSDIPRIPTTNLSKESELCVDVASPEQESV